MAFKVGKLCDYLWDWELTGEENISVETLKTMDHHAVNLAWTEGTDSETQGHLPTAAWIEGRDSETQGHLPTAASRIF